MKAKPDPQDRRNDHEPSKLLDRRSLLAGTAGLGLGALLGAPPALAQHNHRTLVAEHDFTGTLSDRVYSVNPVHPEMADIAENPANVPPPIDRTEPATIDVELETIEVEAHLAHNSTFRFWTFNGTVPGPFIRARVGDTLNVTLKNHPDSWMMHNVDFHAATGPGGGAEATSAAPGEEKSFSFKALNPGIYVYHCAVPPVALHIANGMYGLILIEPEGGLPPVDKEFYVMQGEIYTNEPFGTSGLLTESYEKLLNERPEYFVLNGHVGALTDHYPLRANVGETVRIYYGVGGPNYASNFHVIGEIFDKVYQFGSFVSPPLESVQTVLVPAGGAVAVEFKCEVPGRYVLVDHALSRVERGLAGYLLVEGDAAPDIFDAPEEESE
ncbi:copper-containing nitrite reductase [Pelagibacterium flavum]|uniref:Copper-containing nitrite reductase n=1 Tax=Pelagibacterium flavum TaxID=2984530 RepID=A0ABY6ISG7_9HYPH|nr:copper-containing nitrite reductase [Pelagibacterium sp. YIM 151497]UYQ72635.1 copper-containing nitrite reductase [Pelagibacterium sp. YIM 151497]